MSSKHWGREQKVYLLSTPPHLPCTQHLSAEALKLPVWILHHIGKVSMCSVLAFADHCWMCGSMVMWSAKIKCSPSPPGALPTPATVYFHHCTLTSPLSSPYVKAAVPPLLLVKEPVEIMLGEECCRISRNSKWSHPSDHLPEAIKECSISLPSSLRYTVWGHRFNWHMAGPTLGLESPWL